MGRTFDGIDILFIVLIGLYLLVLFVIICYYLHLNDLRKANEHNFVKVVKVIHKRKKVKVQEILHPEKKKIVPKKVLNKKSVKKKPNKKNKKNTTKKAK